MFAPVSRLLAQSVRDKNIALAGWGRAVYPPGIKRLHNAYERVAGDMPRLSAAARRVAEFPLLAQEDEVSTYDFKNGATQYHWRIVFSFRCDGGEIGILFPRKETDGCYHLHTAAFARGAVKDNIRERLMLLLENFRASIEGG